MDPMMEAWWHASDFCLSMVVPISVMLLDWWQYLGFYWSLVGFMLVVVGDRQ